MPPTDSSQRTSAPPQTFCLRLTQFSVGDANLLEISVEEAGRARETVRVPFNWSLSEQDQANLQWYFEEFLQFPADPAPRIAARVEARIAELGKELFASVFSTDDARDLWSRVRARLDAAHVEILTDVGTATTIPWELLCDPRTDVPIAVRAASFTRGYTNPAQPPRPPAAAAKPVRILLVICRPDGGEDVPFRSVASRLVKGLGERHKDEVRLDVLRPPTFSRLAEVLRSAEDETPHIVHFDGHGTFAASPGVTGARNRGHLAFEDEEAPDGIEWVNGSRIGGLLAETGVPFLILNACQSARSEPMPQPTTETNVAGSQVRAYGSLALEAMDAGVTGVVAMQYNVYVDTAAHFVGDLYATLARGQTLGRAVSLGRKQLHAQPRRDVGLELDIADWPVPVVYEAAAVSLFPAGRDAALFANLEFDAMQAAPVRGTIDPDLPPPPDAGFFGRDETLLAIDRAFDTDRVVLLHAYAGSGKTAAAAEFARWYTLTGGCDGPVLFTSFEHYTPLARVLDDFAALFGPSLEQAGVPWLTLTDHARRDVALKVLSQVPVIWVWDNTEQVAGFPAGVDSAWTDDEQQELTSFLHDLRQTQARVLLTSRRAEKQWLGGLPTRITIPGMPFQERVQLARALARKLGAPIKRLDAWRSLLSYTRGNPLTITVVVGEAVRQGLSTPDEFERFVADLSRGSEPLADDERQGRSTSLNASLSYGFREAFDDEDRRRLALLHLFDGVVWTFLFAHLLQLIEDPDAPESSLDTTPAKRLLDRAAEIGHLTALGGNLYTMHPALPAYFNDLFLQHYPEDAGVSATRAFCNASGGLALTGVAAKQDRGARADLLRLFKPVFLQARRLARRHGWRDCEVAVMAGLFIVYEHDGSWTSWSRLLADTAEGIVEPTTDGPLPGFEGEWRSVTQWRVRLAFARSDGVEAMRLQGLILAAVISSAEEAAAAGRVDDAARSSYDSAAIALMEFGMAQGAQRDVAGIGSLERAVRFAELSGVTETESAASYDLAAVTLMLDADADLERCQVLLEHALELLDEFAHVSRSRCYGELGFIAFRRFEKASDPAEALRWLEASIAAYEQSLELTPPDALESLVAKHTNLGTIYEQAGAMQPSRRHLEEAIRFAEASSQTQAAGQCRAMIALQLRRQGREEDAMLYAERALRDLDRHGSNLDDLVAEIQAMVRQSDTEDIQST